MTSKKLLFGLVLLSSVTCVNKKELSNLDVKSILHEVQNQLEVQLISAEMTNRIPRTLNKDGSVQWTDPKFDWTEGFFPGSCWYMFDFTGDKKWKNAAEKFQNLFEGHKLRTDNHDLGFVFNSSFGNGYRLTNNEKFKDILITAGDSLLTRFNPIVGCIKSWDVYSGWQSERDWKFPVIIDNMMNLELLFKLSEWTGNPVYQEVAIIHANTTLANHFRKDNSSYHVIDYDPVSGKVRKRETAQGLANNSSWARGQAWGLYGFTVCYRYTKDVQYLNMANKIAEHIIRNLPEDGIPYWDYDAPDIPVAFRDASAAAIVASALIELNSYSDINYSKKINLILTTLGSKEYTSELGDNQGFILEHSVGSIPHKVEIDVPLNYADYYYI
tara:strand:- start:1166 stop:2320 length:1155 start_codon:yes stop_codon:yes gene_type:complete